MIVNILNELYLDWFNNKDWWFSKNEKVDTYLSDKYIYYINDIINIKQLINRFKYNKNVLISCVILLDQISRHHKRVYDNNYNIIYYSKVAAKISDYILNIFNTNAFNIEELCFLYLPYRHIYNIDNIYKIIDIFIDKYNNSYNKEKHICKKYIYNTLNNSYKYINNLSYNIKIPVKEWCNINKNILDEKSLLYYYPSFINEESYIYKFIYNEIIKLKNNSTIVISLSGGVDSMVALFIVNNILNINSIKKNFNLIAIHINYNNRKDSYDELDFVNYYCNLLNIKLIHRTIYEINRNKCMKNGLRDLYEDITKKIRLDMYRYGFLFNNKTYVLLGHNKDDCFENIITNISNNNNYDNLSGMDILSEIDNINYWRPMLDISKNDIILFANNNNIPYLIDSTPKWSARGKIRDVIKPALCCLKNNDNIISAFFDLKDNLSDSNKIINDLILNNLVDKFVNNCALYTINELNSFKYINISKLFFKKINIKISYKAIKEFCYYIENVFNNTSRKKIVLNKIYNFSVIKKDEKYKMILNNN